MSTSFSPTPIALRVEITPSNYFRIALLGTTALAFAAIFYARLEWPIRFLLCASALIYCGYCWQIQTRQRGMLQWRSIWFWRGADGIERALRLRHMTLWPNLIVLNFADIEREKIFTLTLLADSFIDADEARRLRVYLNHFPVFAVENSD